MSCDFTIAESETDADRPAILALLQAYNHSNAAPAAVMPLSIVLQDDAGTVIGGLQATSAYDWLIIELVFVPEQLRGQGVGTALLARAEDAAKRRGCVGIWLDTFNFQARAFYERLGYRVFGTVDDHPLGGARYFLKKALACT